MSAYADTSFLYSLYVQQAHSAKAAAYTPAVDNAALPLTTLGRFELLNAIRLSVFRQQLSPRIAAIDVLTIKADIESGVLGMISCDWAAVHAEAERLSARHTADGGHRSMDILHVATALSTGAREFLSFDRKQVKLASAEGLTVKP